MPETEKLTHENDEEVEVSHLISTIFGNTAAIERTPAPNSEQYKESIVINLTLANGIAEGGQRVQVRTHEPQLITVNDQLGHPQQILTLLPESISINSITSVFDDFGTIILLSQEEMAKIVPVGESGRVKDIDRSTAMGQELVAKLSKNAFRSVLPDGKSVIFATSLKDADDLAIFLHEQGHSDDPDHNDKERALVYDQYIDDQKTTPKELILLDRNTKRGLMERWLYIMGSEVVADNLAMRRVISGKQSNAWRQIFPLDSQAGYPRLFKALETINYLHYLLAQNHWYLDNIEEDQKERIPRLTSLNSTLLDNLG